MLNSYFELKTFMLVVQVMLPKSRDSKYNIYINIKILDIYNTNGIYIKNLICITYYYA